MLGKKNHLMSWLLSALLCFNSSFTVLQAEEETIQEEEPVVQEVQETAQTEEPIEEQPEVTEEASPETADPQPAEEEVSQDPQETEIADAEETSEEIQPEEENSTEEESETVEADQNTESNDESDETAVSDEAGEEAETPAEDETDPSENIAEQAAEADEEQSETAATDPAYFTYTISDGAATVTGYSGEEWDIVIPSSLGGKPVRTIGVEAFWESGVETVVIPSGVTAISDNAFSDCVDLTSVSLPSSLKSIGPWAFSNCDNLSSINIPSNVSSIGEGAFLGCGSLADSAGFVIFNKTIYDYYGSSEILVIPAGITVISIQAFSDNEKIKTVTIPSTVKEIGPFAFQNCTNLEQVQIPSSVVSVGEGAFSGCPKLADDQGYLIVNDVLMSYYGSEEEVHVPEGITIISESAFENNTTIRNVYLPDSVTSIGMYAFSECRNLESIRLSNQLRTIGGSAFYYCDKLESITLPDTVTSIGESAFSLCSGLADEQGFVIVGHVLFDYYGNSDHVTVPSGTKRISSDAFSYSGFQSIIIPESVTGIGESAFYSCSKLTSITIPDSVTSIGQSVFIDCTNLKSAVLSNAMTEIDADMFYSCENLESVYIPGSVKRIIYSAFAGCSALKHVYYGGTSKQWNAISIEEDNDALLSAQLHTGSGGIPNENFAVSANKDGTLTITEYIGEDSAVVIPSKINGKKVTAIGDSLFQNSNTLTSVVIPDGITTIGKLAFWNCKNLEKIVIPESVNAIGNSAFWGCTQLTNAGPIGSGANIEIDFGNQVKTAFSGVQVNSDGSASWGNPTGGLFSYLESIDIPESVTEICDYAFVNCTGLYWIELPDAVTSIGKFAFSGCENLDVIDMPANLMHIGALAFQGTLITEAVLPDTLTKIDGQAFEGAEYLEKVVIPDSVVSIEHGAFADCVSLYDITIPDSVTDIGSNAFKNCRELKEIVIPEGETDLQISTFEGCSSLKSATLPESLRSIGTSAFKNCTQLTSITIPSDVFSIGYEAFKGCTSLQNVVIETKNNLWLGESAFEDCTSLTKFDASSITNLSSRAFAGCTSLEEVGLIKLEKLPDYVFMNCSSLQTVKLAGKLTEIGTGAFRYCPDGINIVFYGTKAQWNKVTVKNYNDPLKNANIIYIAVPTAVSFKQRSIEISYGETVKLPFVIEPADADPSFLTWSSSNPDTVSVDQNGNVTGLKNGSALIWATTMNDQMAYITVTTKYIDLKSITIKAPKPSINIGESMTIEALFEPANASNKEIRWVSGNEEIASITGDGVIQGLNAGTVTIYAESTDNAIRSNELSIEITQPAESVSLDKESAELAIRDTIQLNAAVSPENASNKNVSWSSSDESIAVVDENGVVTAVSEGTAVITVITEDGGFTDTCTVTCYTVAAEGISVNEEGSVSEIEFGRTGTIQIDFEPANTTNQNLAWSSSDETIAVVDENGIITAVGEGTVTITATSEDGGFTASKTINVFYTHIEKVAFAEEAVETVVGKTCSLNILFTPENASNKAVSYVSSNEHIAAVDQEGIVTGVSEGTAEITVITDDGNQTAQCMVTVLPAGLYIEGLESSYRYTGTAVKPVISVYDAKTLLTEKTDYTVTYKNTTKAYSVADPDHPTATDKKKAPQIIIKSNSKGNYAGTKTVYFTIDPVNLNDEKVTVDALSVQETGKALSPIPAVYFNGKKLKNKTDYTVDYGDWDRMTGDDNNQAEITIIAKPNGNFKGERKVIVYVAPKDTAVSVSRLKVTAAILKYADLTEENFIESVTNAITVKDGNTSLDETEYIIKDIDPEDRAVGNIKVTLEGKGKYVGERTVTVKITGITLTDKKVKAKTGLSYPYTGEEVTFTPETHLVSYNGTDLTEGTDYVIDSYSKNLNAGTAAVTLKGINNYTGTKKVSFKITPVTDPVEDNRIHIAEAFYSKGGSKPEVTIDGMTLNTDYTLKYTKNTKADTQGTVTITFKGNYKGTPAKQMNFYINPKDISEVTVTSKDKVYSAKANAWKSAPVLTDTDGKKLKAGVDYEKTIAYTTEDGEEVPAVVDAGTVIKVTVTGKGNYTGTAETYYRILETGKDISKAVFKIADQEYTGRGIVITDMSQFTGTDDARNAYITVNKQKEYLVLGEDFEVVPGSYVKNINKGTAKVTFRGINEYGGTKTVSFKIKVRSILENWFDGFSYLKISGYNETYLDPSDVTIEFSEARLRTETLKFISWEDNQVHDYQVNVIRVKPGSFVKINEANRGDTTDAYPVAYHDGYYEGYPRGMTISTGNVSEWPTTIFDNGDVIGLINLFLKDNDTGNINEYYIMIDR